jgi:hypothetical protein
MERIAAAIHRAVLAGELGRRLEQDCMISDLVRHEGSTLFTVQVGGATFAVTIATVGDNRAALH